MYIPSLMKIVLNSEIKDQKTGFAMGARELISQIISDDIKIRSPDIAFLRNYTCQVATEDDIQVIHTDYNQGLYSTVYKKDLYINFTKTALYQRLEALRFMHITLKDICINSDKIRDEIREAVIQGFEQEILSYYLEGIASNPYYRITIHPLPANDMNISAIFEATKPKYQHIKQSIKIKLDLDTKNVIKAVLEYFSKLLAKCNNLDQLDVTISWINKYVVDNIENSFWTLVDLEALIKYKPMQDAEVKINNFKILYKIYGHKLFEVKSFEERIFQLKSFIVLNLNVQEIINDFAILQKHNLTSNVFASIDYKESKKIGFLERVCYLGKDTFQKLLETFTDDMLWQALQVPYNSAKGISMLQHIITQSMTKTIFNWIVEKCSIKVLIQIANIEIIDENSFPQKIYNILNDLEFAQIVLKRVNENGIWRQIEDLPGYTAYVDDNEDTQEFYIYSESLFLENEITDLTLEDDSSADETTITGSI